MNEVELAERLRAALDATGQTRWELSRRANVKLSLVDEMLDGTGRPPIRALDRVAQAMGLSGPGGVQRSGDAWTATQLEELPKPGFVKSPSPVAGENELRPLCDQNS